jgi:PPE-repeat protein
MLLSSYQSWTLKVTGNVTRIWVAEHNQAIRVSGNREKQENAAKNFLQFTLIWWTQTRTFFISVFNQLDAQNFCFTISLFHASTWFEHMCSTSGGQNCITQPLVSSNLWLWWYQSCVTQFWPTFRDNLSVLDYMTLQDGTGTFSRNVSNGLPLCAA